MTVHRFIARDGPGPSRNGLVTDMDGWELHAFRLNPVVFHSHRTDLMPIGRADVTLRGQQMLAGVEFADTVRGREADKLVGEGMLRGMSVGARLLEWEMIRGEHGEFTGVHSHRQELLELSVVGIPSQSTALVKTEAGEMFTEYGLAREGLPEGGPLLVVMDAVLGVSSGVVSEVRRQSSSRAERFKLLIECCGVNDGHRD